MRGVEARDQVERGELERFGARGEEGAVGRWVGRRGRVWVGVELCVEAEDSLTGGALSDSR